MGAEMTARKPASSKPMAAPLAMPKRISFWSTLLRSMLIAAILVATFAQPALRPYCAWSELAGYCSPGDDGGCVWDDSAGTCW
jgi:hypothetical protein